MTDASLFHEDVPKILEISRYAPSVHNSQPWLVRLDDMSLEISIDESHKLTHGDPTGRQTIISLGIFTEAVRLVAQDLGWNAHKQIFKDKIVTIKFKKVRLVNQSSLSSKLLKSRCSDRSIFKNTKLDKHDISAIQKVKRIPGVKAEVTDDKEIIASVAVLTSKAISVALSSPSFREELIKHLVFPWSKNKRGISIFSLSLPWFLEFSEPLLLRLGVGLKNEHSLELRRWLSASALILITAKGDMPRFWLEAGRTYLRVCLEVENLGLSQATSAAIVEASNYHEDIESLLHTKQRILGVIRIGMGEKAKHYSPRINVSELLH